MLIPHTKWEKQQKEGFQEKHRPLRETVESGQEKGYDFNGFTQDLFSSLYQMKPEFPENATPGASWAKKALDELHSLQDYKDVRNHGTVCDSLQSGLGATILAKHFSKILKPTDKPNPDDLKKMLENIDILNDEKPSQKLQDRMKELEKQLPESEQVWSKIADDMSDVDVRQALRRAMSEWQQKSDEIEAYSSAFGFGKEPGDDGYTDSSVKLKVAEMIKNSEKLRRLAEIAGRFRREARKVQANKKQPGPDELTNIEIGDSMDRLLPSEMMKLGDPLLEVDFMRKYLEKSLMQYKLETAEKEQKGPIIVCIDNSGSMEGDREVFSKAVALAMCRIASDQKRNFEIIHFNTNIVKVDVFVGKVDPVRLLESMAFFSGGGTDFERPLMQALTDIELSKFKKADIIFITDSMSEISEQAISKFKLLKGKTGASIYTVLIGKVFFSQGLNNLSDEVINIEDLNEKHLNDRIKHVLFSI